MAVPVGAAQVTALNGVGTTDWTSSDARIVWGGVSSPPTSFAWHAYPYPVSDQVPIAFTTASFPIPGPGDVVPGALSWDFQANPEAHPGFETGHTQCNPVAPEQIYATFVVASGPSCPHDGLRWTCRFSYTGAAQLWQVPADVHKVTVDVRGSSGEDRATNGDVDKSWPGGRGGESVATVAVTPGEYLTLMVGGTNGFNGGGAGSASGGGASDVRRTPFGLSNRLVVAGGGGGGGFDLSCTGGCPDHSGGAGGGLTGIGSDGGPGTQTSGGAAQAPSDPNFPSSDGTFGAGGAGFSGGGGGYYGGGGGTLPVELAQGGGGGGGSGFVPAGQGNTTVAGANSGYGSIAVSYTSTTTPYTSRYTTDEANWLLTDMAALHTPDLATTQHHAALFMIGFGALIRITGGTLPNLGSAPGSGPIAVTSTYTRAENASLLRSAALFRSDPPTVQRTGVAVLAFLAGKAGH